MSVNHLKGLVRANNLSKSPPPQQASTMPSGGFGGRSPGGYGAMPKEGYLGMRNNQYLTQNVASRPMSGATGGYASRNYNPPSDDELDDYDLDGYDIYAASRTGSTAQRGRGGLSISTGRQDQPPPRNLAGPKGRYPAGMDGLSEDSLGDQDLGDDFDEPEADDLDNPEEDEVEDAQDDSDFDTIGFDVKGHTEKVKREIKEEEEREAKRIEEERKRAREAEERKRKAEEEERKRKIDEEINAKKRLAEAEKARLDALSRPATTPKTGGASPAIEKRNLSVMESNDAKSKKGNVSRDGIPTEVNNSLNKHVDLPDEFKGAVRPKEGELLLSDEEEFEDAKKLRESMKFNDNKEREEEERERERERQREYDRDRQREYDREKLLKGSSFSFNRYQQTSNIPVLPAVSNAGVFKELVTEALLYDEKVKGRHNAADAEMANQRVTHLSKELMEAKSEISAMGLKVAMAQDQKRRDDAEIVELKKNNQLYRTENDELIKIIDVKDLKIQELLNLNQALEKDNIHKKSLLYEKQEFFKKQFVNSLLEAQQKVYEDQIGNLKTEIDMLHENMKAMEEAAAGTQQPMSIPAEYQTKFAITGGQQISAQESASQQDKLNTKITELEAEIEQLRLKLIEKEKVVKKELVTDLATKENIVNELMVKGFAKENNRLIAECQDLKTLLAEKEDQALRDKRQFGREKGWAEGTLRFEEEDKLKETIQRLQEELLRKDEFFRTQSLSNKEKLEKFSALEADSKEFTKRITALEKIISQKESEIHEIKLKAKDAIFEAGEKTKAANDEREKMRKDAQKKSDESQRVRDENINLRKEMRNAKEKITKLETENNELKDKKDVSELNKKIKSLNQTIKDLQERTKSSPSLNQTAKTPAELKTGQAAIKIRDRSVSQERPKESDETVLRRLLEENDLPNQLKELAVQLGRRYDARPSTASAQNTRVAGRVPIKRDVNILDSEVPLPVDEPEEVYFGLNLDMDENAQKRREDRQPTPSGSVLPKAETPKLFTVGDDPNGKKRFIRAVIDSLPKQHPLVSIEQIWDKVMNYYLPKDLTSVKPVLLQMKEQLSQLELDIGQNALLTSVNTAITMYNRGDMPGVHHTLTSLDSQYYGMLFSMLPSLLIPSSLDTRDDGGLREELQRVKKEKASLEEIIRMTPVAPRDIDFAVLQKKIDQLEQKEKLRQLETMGQLAQILNKDSHPGEEEWPREREKLIQIIKTKNREITRFRQEVDDLVLKLKELKHTSN